jgi:hypothetical protein
MIDAITYVPDGIERHSDRVLPDGRVLRWRRDPVNAAEALADAAALVGVPDDCAGWMEVTQ